MLSVSLAVAWRKLALICSVGSFQRLVYCVLDELLRVLGMGRAEFNRCHPCPLQRGVGSFAGSCRECLGLLSCGCGAAAGRESSEAGGVNACTPERQKVTNCFRVWS